MSFFGRIASATDLPARIATRYQAPVYMVYPRRRQFWRAELHIERLEVPCTLAAITQESHRHLESYLESDDDACADWLWMHSRWKLDEHPRRRMGLALKKSLHDFSTDHAPSPQRPANRLRFWIRLPDQWEQAKQLLPLIKKLRWSRPDASFTLLAPHSWASKIVHTALAEAVIVLPQQLAPSLLQCWKLRLRYPDALIVLSQSLRGDLESWLTRSPQRFGLALNNKKRWLLNYAKAPDTQQLQTSNQQSLQQTWQSCLHYFGLREREPRDRDDK